MSEPFGDTDRLDPSDARRLFDQLAYAMRTRANKVVEAKSEIEASENGPSIQKQYYGDTWSFIYGIQTGMNLMKEEKDICVKWENGGPKKEDNGVKGDDSWQEHYDEYGYGAYGRGLKIGKRLAFYEDRDFTFSNKSDESSSTSEKFTIKSYDNE